MKNAIKRKEPLKLYFIIILLLLISAAVYGEEQKPRVGVLDFTAIKVPNPEALVVGNIFRGDIVSANVFDVLDRNNMNAILAEQEFQQSGCTEASCAVQIGKLLNMEYMLYGSVSRLGDSYIIQVEMINIETSKIFLSAKKKFVSIEKADEAVSIIISDIQTKMGYKADGKKAKKLKPVLFTISAALGAAAVTMNGLGYRESNLRDKAYANYSDINIANNATLASQYYDETIKHQQRMNAFNIIAYSGYALSAGLSLWGILSPSKKKQLAFMPGVIKYGDKLYAAISIQY